MGGRGAVRTVLFLLGGNAVALAVFGGPSLYGLSVIMLFGIVIGTYSSIYIAAPVILLWGVKRTEEDAAPLAPQTAR